MMITHHSSFWVVIFSYCNQNGKWIVICNVIFCFVLYLFNVKMSNINFKSFVIYISTSECPWLRPRGLVFHYPTGTIHLCDKKWPIAHSRLYSISVPNFIHIHWVTKSKFKNLFTEQSNCRYTKSWLISMGNCILVCWGRISRSRDD